jgi:hypothetical protein
VASPPAPGKQNKDVFPLPPFSATTSRIASPSRTCIPEWFLVFGDQTIALRPAIIIAGYPGQLVNKMGFASTRF